VPESEKDASGKWVSMCNLRVSFKGLLKIATDSGSILWAKAEIVKAADKFTYRGPCELPAHEMDSFGDRGATVGVYCIAKTHQGDYLVDVMSAAEIKVIRGSAKQDGVWSKWPEEMAKKAIIKRASKQWPKTDRSDRLDRAIAVLNEYEGSTDIAHERDVTPQPEVQQLPPAKKTLTDARLMTAIEKIRSREYTLEKLIASHELTDTQKLTLEIELADFNIDEVPHDTV
jgi:recombination protein RecT